MKASKNGRALIAAFEGLFLKAYDDGEGVLTIGYGHTSAAGYPKVTAGMTITREQAENVLSNDLAPIEARVGKLIKAPLSQGEFDALVSFEFNTGDLAKSSLPAKINSGRKATAMDTLLLYVHGANTGKVYAGLVRRRKAERLMFEGNVAGALKLAGLADTSYDLQPRAHPPPPGNATSPSVTEPPKPSALAAFLSAFVSIFRRT